MGVCLNTLKTRIGRLPSNAKDSFEPVDSSIESMCKDSFELFFADFMMVRITIVLDFLLKF